MPTKDTTTPPPRQSAPRHRAFPDETSDILEFQASLLDFARRIHPVTWNEFVNAALCLMDGLSRHDAEMGYDLAEVPTFRSA